MFRDAERKRSSLSLKHHLRCGSCRTDAQMLLGIHFIKNERFDCVVPENIHTSLPEGVGFSGGGGGGGSIYLICQLGGG